MNHTIFNMSIKDFIFSLTSFQACNYSWYIEMYIDLYLITPLLNRGYNSFDSKSRKIITIIFLGIGIIPGLFNDYFQNLLHIPSSWTCLYILTYYFLGKSIATFKPSYNKKYLILLSILNVIMTFFTSKTNNLSYDNLLIFTQAVLMFLTFYNLTIKSKSNKIFTFFSKYSLDIYLASSLIDYILYFYFFKFINTITQPKMLFYMPLLVIISFSLSTIYGMIRYRLLKLR